MDTGYSGNHPRAVSALEVVDHARAMVGTPYLHQGRTRFGVDCVGFIVVVMQRCGNVPRELEHANYGRLPKSALIERTREHCTPIKGPEPGALILIRWPGDLNPGHVAIHTGHDGLMIHAYQTLGRVVEHGYRGAWVKLTHSFWRLPGVDVG